MCDNEDDRIEVILMLDTGEVRGFFQVAYEGHRLELTKEEGANLAEMLRAINKRQLEAHDFQNCKCLTG